MVLLKWYYAQFSWQKLGYNSNYLKNAIYNDERQINGNFSCQDKRIKRLPQSFYFLKVKCICTYFFSSRCVETIFKIKINTLVTKYTDLCTYHLSSALHNATLKQNVCLLKTRKYYVYNKGL